MNRFSLYLLVGVVTHVFTVNQSFADDFVDAGSEYGTLCDQNCRNEYFDRLKGQTDGAANKESLKGQNPNAGDRSRLGEYEDNTTCDCVYNMKQLFDHEGKKVQVIRNVGTPNIQFSDESIDLVKNNPRPGFFTRHIERRIENIRKKSEEEAKAKAASSPTVEPAVCRGANVDQKICSNRKEEIAKLDSIYKDLEAKKKRGETLSPEDQEKMAMYQDRRRELAEETLYEGTEKSSVDNNGAVAKASDQTDVQPGSTPEEGEAPATINDGRTGSETANGTGTQIPGDNPVADWAADNHLTPVTDNNGTVYCPRESGSTSYNYDSKTVSRGDEKCLNEQQIKDEIAKAKKKKEDAAKDTAKKEEYASNQPKRKGWKGSDDSCGPTVNAMLVKEAIALKGGNPSRDDLIHFMNTDSNFLNQREKIESKYSCDASITVLDVAEKIDQGMKVAATVTTGVVTGMAQYEVQKASGDPNQNVHRVANDQMANSMVKTGMMQTGMGAVQFIFKGIAGLDINREQNTALKDLNKYNTDPNEVAKTGNQQTEADLTNAGATMAVLDRKAAAGPEAAEEYNAEGEGYVQSSRNVHREVKDRAAQTSATGFIEGALNLAQGILSWKLGSDMKCDEDNTSPACLGPMASPPPPLVGGSPEQVEASGSVPVPMPGVSGGDASPVIAEGVENLEEEAFDDRFPLPGGGGGGGGGNNLLQRPDPHKANFVAGTGSGTGGSVGGGGGGGGGSAPRGNEKGGVEKTLSASGKKFGDSLAAGGAGFGSSGGAAKRSDGTNMDMGGLFDKLGNLLPNNRKEKKEDSSILDFGTRGIASAGSGTEVDDGTILGRNSNLFLRVSNTTMTYYKKGRLK